LLSPNTHSRVKGPALAVSAIRAKTAAATNSLMVHIAIPPFSGTGRVNSL